MEGGGEEEESAKGGGSGVSEAARGLWSIAGVVMWG